MTDYILGIDGGGTSCRAAVARPDGAILGRGKSGAANILTDPNNAIISITEAAKAAYRDAGLDEAGVNGASAFLGLAGTNVGDLTRYVHDRLPFRHTAIDSDGLIALQGAIGDEDGAVAILGTGSIYMGRKDGTVRYIGGWGFTVGDLGGGARLGHALLQEALLAFDGVHPRSPVTNAVIEEFKNDPRGIVEFARLSKPGDFGRFAPLLFDHAGQGDAQAIAIVETGATAVNESLDAIMALAGASRLCLLGGLASLYPQWLSEKHRSILIEAEADALTGAVALAAKGYQERQGAVA
ncbi:N-acetylglucosamine kinase [Shinella curvata]|uniref:N-acetylglucosamine kinase n=1 Tax=Shinella curvata TaxID=1817964 RepID=A0ABT8X8B8_9HYPH|nr:N-acetylglucosamine kinase [Shinella curvata]MCJ8052347.1 N-acetylglucosamine kinase [Shinella curvata]MDO6119704.1 N-acetylglucosamine kinase [Shinella curvata]